MRILVDTNVFLDIILERHPFFEHAAKLLHAVPLKDIEIFLTATTVTDLYYIVRKAKDRTIALSFIKDLLKLVEVSAVDKDVILQALQLGMADFEDAIQVSSANGNGITIVETRNEADFIMSGLDGYTPEAFLSKIT